ncbi:hypothetical protein [Bradyrhizobium sp. Tv2a-2]|uniref:hypothetical protein n=1 Tax=Bradyrhizobium sp. Tv2a-2 TaxID=113395 RepID=UPI0012EC5B74|nr:hypothetical protein [Bradyrhizobium sp. Tv2a-2]
MDLFKAEKVGETPSDPEKKCRCGADLELIRTIFDANSRTIIHMFECACGERIWDE